MCLAVLFCVSFKITHINIRFVYRAHGELNMVWNQHIVIMKSSLIHASTNLPGVTTLHLRGDKSLSHDEVMNWKHFPRYWPFVRGIHRWPVNSPHKGQWCTTLMYSFICAWINGWVNNREAGELRPHRAHYDVVVMRIKMTKVSDTIWRHQATMS